jgi:hypothetical protein
VLGADGLTLYFRRNVDGAAAYDIFVATRSSTTLPFGAAMRHARAVMARERHDYVATRGL